MNKIDKAILSYVFVAVVVFGAAYEGNHSKHGMSPFEAGYLALLQSAFWPLYASAKVWEK